MSRRVSIPFVGGAYTARSTNINAQSCINLYPVMDKEGGKVAALMNTPGLDLWAAAPAASEVRGLHVMNNTYLFAVIGNTLQKYTDDGTRTQADETFSSTTGKVWMEDDGVNLMIVDSAGHGYTYTLAGNEITLITDADFPTPAFGLAYQDGYFIVNSLTDGRFYISALKDPTSWNALDYGTAESYSDWLVAHCSTGRELWLLGKENYEIWYNSGASDFPFERMSGGVFKGGCAGNTSVAVYGDHIFMRAADGSIKMSNGYQFQTISPPQVEYSMPPLVVGLTHSGIHGSFCYHQEGHTFYVLNPNSTTVGVSSTWVYDVDTGLWHERRSGTTNLKWRAACGVYYPLAQKTIVGDYANGVLYSLNLGTYYDYQAGGNVAITKTRTAQAVYADGRNMFHHALEIEFEGTPPPLETGSATLSWSDDGGATFNAGIAKSLGVSTKPRVIWRRLGKSRDRIYKITSTVKNKFGIIGAWLEVEEANS